MKTCKKCNNNCKQSKALLNTLVFSNDFGNDFGICRTTQSRVGETILVDCYKCEKCGHSFVPVLLEKAYNKALKSFKDNLNLENVVLDFVEFVKDYSLQEIEQFLKEKHKEQHFIFVYSNYINYIADNQMREKTLAELLGEYYGFEISINDIYLNETSNEEKLQMFYILREYLFKQGYSIEE